MTTTLTRDLLDKEEAIAAFYQGVEVGAGREIASIKQKGLSLTIEFEA